MKATMQYFPGVLVPVLVFYALFRSRPFLDMGEMEASFQIASAGYVVLISPILLRRLRKPTSTDLHMITWGLPVLFFLALGLIGEAATYLPRLDINWGMVGRLWEDH